MIRSRRRGVLSRHCEGRQEIMTTMLVVEGIQKLWEIYPLALPCPKKGPGPCFRCVRDSRKTLSAKVGLQDHWIKR